MADSTAKKGFLKTLRDSLRWVAHMALVPLVAVLKALATLFSHLHDEISEI